MSNVQVVSAVLPASDFDLTIPGFGDVEGALIWVGNEPLNSLRNWNIFSFGMWARNGDQAAIGFQSADNQSISNTGRGYSYTDCVMVPTAGGTTSGQIRRASPITDGIRLTKIDATTAGRSVIAMFFKNCNFAVGTRTAVAGTETINLGFRANLVASAMNDLASGSDVAASAHAIINTGWASANFQAGSTAITQDAVGSTTNVSDIRFTAPALRHWWTSGGPGFDVHIENFTDTSFDFRGVNGSKPPQGGHIWCAIGFGDANSDATMASGTAVANTLTNVGLGDDNGLPTEAVIAMTTYYDIAPEGTQELDNVFAWTTFMQGSVDPNPTLIAAIDEDAQTTSDAKSATYNDGTLPIFSDQGTTNQGTGNLAVGNGVAQSVVGINMPSFSGQRFFGIAIKGATSAVKNIFLGAEQFSNIQLGAEKIYKVFQGSNIVWDIGDPPPPFTLDAVDLSIHGRWDEGSGTVSADKAQGGVNWTVGGTWDNVDVPHDYAGSSIIHSADVNSLYRERWPVTNSSNFPCTVMFWFKIPSGQGDSRVSTGAELISDFYNGHEIRMPTSIRPAVSLGSGVGGGNSVYRRSHYWNGRPNYADDQWHHLAVRHDTMNNVELFIDGVSWGTSDESSGSETTFGWRNSSQCRMNMNSHWSNQGNGTAWGKISDFRMYTDSISDERILSIAQGKS